MGRTIGLVSIKGGVGKTTISSALATNLANFHGKKVLLVDANYSAPNLGLHMDIISPEKTIHDVLAGDKISSAIHRRFGVDVVPGSYFFRRGINLLKLKDKLRHIKDRYDFVILDSSPSLNDEVFSAMLASDEIFLVSSADYPTLSCSMKAARLARQRNRKINGVIVNMVSNPAYEVSLREIQESVGIPVVAMVPDDKSVKKSLFSRIPATIYHNKSRFSGEIEKLSAILAGKREKKSLFKKIFGGNFREEQVNREVLRQSFYTSMFKD